MPPKTRKRAVKSDDADDSENKAPEHEVKKKNIEKALKLKEEPAQQNLGDINPDQRFPQPNCHVYVEDGVVYDATLNQASMLLSFLIFFKFRPTSVPTTTNSTSCKS